jgi:hypothetical protein
MFKIFLCEFQDELDATADVWGAHVIRPSKNERVPFGRPNVIYTVPELYDTKDYLCEVSANEVNGCHEQCTFRSNVACDSDVFELCTIIMAEQNLNIPMDVYEALDLYLELRAAITALI